MQRRTLRMLLAGVLIGIGCVLPGVSGGVMAVSFGLYRPMLDAVMHFFKTPKKHFAFLLPLAAGGSVGMLLSAQGLAAAMKLYETPMLYLFTGFILGGIPDLLHEAEQHERFRPAWLIALFLGVSAALPLAVWSAQGQTVESLSPMQSFLAGLMEGVGTVVPGISTSFVLLRLGWYQAYLKVLSVFAPMQTLLIGAGFLLSAMASMKAVQWLFDRHAGYAYYAVLGFLLVSVALVFPGVETGGRMVLDTGLLVSGAFAARRLGNKQKE